MKQKSVSSCSPNCQNRELGLSASCRAQTSGQAFSPPQHCISSTAMELERPFLWTHPTPQAQKQVLRSHILTSLRQVQAFTIAAIYSLVAPKKQFFFLKLSSLLLSKLCNSYQFLWSHFMPRISNFFQLIIFF